MAVKRRYYVKVKDKEGLSSKRIYRTKERTYKEGFVIIKGKNTEVRITHGDMINNKIIISNYNRYSYMSQYPITRVTENIKFNCIYPIPNNIEAVYKITVLDKQELTEEIVSLRNEISGLDKDIMILNDTIDKVLKILKSNSDFIENCKYKESKEEEERIENIKAERQWKERQRRFNEPPSALYEYANYILGRIR